MGPVQVDHGARIAIIKFHPAAVALDQAVSQTVEQADQLWPCEPRLMAQQLSEQLFLPGHVIFPDATNFSRIYKANQSGKGSDGAPPRNAKIC
jgi:hypothetical protein